MRKVALSLLAPLATLALAQSAAKAADVTALGANATRDEIINNLVPDDAGPADPRGLHAYGSRLPPGQAAPVRATALDIRFAPNSARLTPEAEATLKQLAAAMQSQQLASYRFRIEGHTDTSGRPAVNLKLSEARAQAVKSDLVTQFKIAADRLEAVGRGEEDLLDSAHPRSPVNRRVKIVTLAP